MSKYLKYLSYLLRHKWFVLIECCRLGIIWRGIVHDWSKFLPSEFIPYARYFYGSANPCEAVKVIRRLAFDTAWLHHQRRNRHHHQYWLLKEDSGTKKVLEMPPVYRKEMLADWIGAGRAMGKDDVGEWYLANSQKMVLGENTRRWVEDNLPRQRR